MLKLCRYGGTHKQRFDTTGKGKGKVRVDQNKSVKKLNDGEIYKFCLWRVNIFLEKAKNSTSIFGQLVFYSKLKSVD